MRRLLALALLCMSLSVHAFGQYFPPITVSGGGVAVGGSGTAGAIARFTAASTIGDSGLFQSGTFIGIGTLVPPAALSVFSSLTTSPRGIMSGQFNTGTEGARFHMRKARGTSTTPLIVVTGDTIGRLVGSAYDGANYLEMAGIDFGVSGTVALTRTPTFIAFNYGTNATPSVLTEGMRLINNGNFGIGTTTPGAKLDVKDGLIYLSDTDVAQPLTIIWPATTYGTIGPFSGTAGGTQVIGLSDTDATAYNITGLLGTATPTATTPAVTFTSGKFLSTGSSQALAATETAFQFKNAATNLVTVTGNGNVGIGTATPTAGKLAVVGDINATTYETATNCADSAGAAACGSAAAGAVVIDAGATTVVVSTTAVTANSRILVSYDSSLATELGITCNATAALPYVTARTAATSFTISVAVAPITNPGCFNYFLVN